MCSNNIQHKEITHTSTLCSSSVRVLIIRMCLVFADKTPMRYFSSFHHGLPKLLAQSDLGQGGGT